MNKNLKTVLLCVAGLMILVGLSKPDISSLLKPSKPVAIDVLELSEPTDTNLNSKAVVFKTKLVAVKDHKQDSKKLRDLYIDLAKLVELDEENQVVTNTEEVRQANSLAGVMLRLDIKGKYKDLPETAKEVITSAIGDDQIPLSKELRAKAVEGFLALAWACNEAYNAK
jgi:hypothetical protein